MHKKTSRYIDLLFLIMSIVICGIMILRMANGQYTVYKSIYALTVTFEPTFLVFFLVLAFILFVNLTGVPRKFFRREEEQKDKEEIYTPKIKGTRFTPPKRKRKKSWFFKLYQNIKYVPFQRMERSFCRDPQLVTN